MTKRMIGTVAFLGCLVVVVGCMRQANSAAEANKALVRTFADASNTHDFERFQSILTPNFTRHSQATPDIVVSNPQQFVEFLKQNQATFPDERVTIHRMVADDSLVAVWATYAGTQEGPMGPFPATGKPMSVDFGAFFRIEGDRIAELWVTWDNLAGLAQLGLFPPEPPDSQ